ncbi:DNA repair protein, partial [Pseudoalteromonas sp. S1650]
WSQTDVAKIVGVSWNHKGSTVVRKWETATDKPEHRKISYSAWRGLLCRAGVVSEF